jgi:hypothetical protein
MPTPTGPQFLKHEEEAPARVSTRWWGRGYNPTVLDVPKKTRTTYIYRKDDPSKTRAYLTTETESPVRRTSYPKDYEYNQKWVEDTTKYDNQIPLFLHDSKPATTKVDAMESTKEDRVAAMTMMGIADRESQLEGRGPLTPSNDLSKHSLRMVKHLEEKGATTTDVTSPTNDFSFLPKGGAPFFGNLSTTELPDDAVQAGRRRVREVLRTPKPQVTGEQTQLFDDTRYTKEMTDARPDN